jgi:ubiquinone biosynthesis protein
MPDITAIPALGRHAMRVAEIARVLAKYGLADWLGHIDSRSLHRWTDGTEIARLSDLTHEARIRLALAELGTTFIKFGQVLSTRLDLIGPALADELAELQGNVPADPFPVVQQTIESELKRPLVELFAEFEPVPLASASIGQVHRAKLHDGRSVVLKVQHANIQRKVADDLAILKELAALAERHLPDASLYRPIAVVEEFERVLLRELDFRRELRYLQMFRQDFVADPRVCLPEPHPGYSTSRVLTMERLDGIAFTHFDRVKAAGGDGDDLARRGARIFIDMVFQNGFFHADPHPGNLLFLPPTPEHPQGRIGLLDLGMVGRLDANLRDRIERGMSAVVRHDAAAVTEIVLQVGEVPPHLDARSLEGEVAEQLAYYWGMPLDQFQLGAALNDLTAAIRRYRIALPSGLAMLLRVLVVLEGTGRRLSPQFNLVELIEPFQRTVRLRRFSPRSLLRRFLADARDWNDLLRGLPSQLGGILRAAHRQELGVQLLHRHLEPSVNRLVFGLMVSALFVGSAMMWAANVPPRIWDTSLFGMLGCFAGIVLGFRLFRAIQRSGKLEEHENR